MFGSFRSPDSGQVSGANSTQQTSNPSPFTQSASGGSLFSAQQDSGSSPFTQSAFAGSGGGFNQSPSAQEQSGNAPQQQQQSASGFSFGSQQAPQQQSMQTGGGLFGQAAPQQTSFSFGQQQQQMQQHPIQQQPIQSSRPRRFGQKQWSLEGSALSSRLEWVSTKDGTIPLDAVEGGWCSKMQEPYYIARCTTNHGRLAYGYALKSTSICYCDIVRYDNIIGPFKIHSSSSFEVLVNPDGVENLSWVPLFDSFYDKMAFITPTNPFGFNDNGKIVYIGRTFASKTMDSVPGVCVNINGLGVCIEETDSSWKKFIPQGFEVLCRVGDVGSNHTVKQCYLYDVEYSDVEKTCDMEYIIISSTVLQNNCSEAQRFQWNPLQLNPAQQLTADDKIEGLLWDIGRDMKHKCEVKAAVPYAPRDHDETLSISYTKIGELPLGFGTRPQGYNGMGLGFGVPFAAMNELVQSIDDDESQPGMLGKPAAHIVLGKMAKKSGIGQQSFGFMSSFGPTNEGFRVPGNSKIKVGISGCKKTVMVTFTGKLKTVYGNNLVEDEEVKGTFTGVYLTSIVRTILDQLLLSS